MKSRIYTLSIAIIGIAISIWGYFNLPEQVPMHWNIYGMVDRYGSKLQSVIMFPIIILISYILLIFLPKIDPRKENYKKFKDSYYIIVNAILTLQLILQGITLAAGIGYNIKMEIIVPFIIGILFIILGNYMQRVKSNYFIGIRTPWALQDDVVWKETNRFGAKMFVLAGLLLIVTAFVPPFYKIILFILAIILCTVIPIVWSYFLYKKLHH